MVFSKSTCPFCQKLKRLFKSKGLTDYMIFEVDQGVNGNEVYSALKKYSGKYTVP